MTKRDLSLSPRRENIRAIKEPVLPKQFSVEEILEHFNTSIGAIKNQYLIADELMKNNNINGCKIIWRSQVVFAEGLLDFFIHEISKYCVFQMFIGEREKTKKYHNLDISMSILEKALNCPDSKEWFFKYLNNRFSRDVFLSYESMKNQLNLIGIPFTSVMEKVFPDDNQEDALKKGKYIVNMLFDRRNTIVHQDDRSHETAEQNDISKEFVEDYINKIEKIVNTIYELNKNKVITDVQ